MIFGKQKSLDEYSRVARFLLQLADYHGEGVLSCVGLLLLLQEVLVPEPLPGQERRQEDAQVGEGQLRQVQFGHR